MVATAPNREGRAASDDESRLVLVSNRGPIEHYFDEAGEIRTRTAGGGVAVAPAAASRTRHVSWIAGACSPAGRSIAQSFKTMPWGSDGSLRLVSVPGAAAQPYYNSFCNPILWFVQHSLGGELRSRGLDREVRESWLSGYVAVNRLFADAVISEIDRYRTDGTETPSGGAQDDGSDEQACHRESPANGLAEAPAAGH
ncbi:MAG: hypothetical protein GEU75_03975 [Dehalococcoidia bacterium]|nr:hypothetical protein [Dehalococcoidia bacterium]